MQGTAEFHDQIADTFLPQADAVFDDATALHAAVDMFDPQPAVVQESMEMLGIRPLQPALRPAYPDTIA
jgi:hypothetical protein